jgi:hypothetical protein
MKALVFDTKVLWFETVSDPATNFYLIYDILETFVKTGLILSTPAYHIPCYVIGPNIYQALLCVISDVIL